MPVNVASGRDGLSTDDAKLDLLLFGFSVAVITNRYVGLLRKSLYEG